MIVASGYEVVDQLCVHLYRDEEGDRDGDEDQKEGEEGQKNSTEAWPFRIS